MKFKRSALCLLLAAVLLTGLLSGCGADTETGSAEDFAGKKLGVVTGTVYEDVARAHYPEAELCFYNSCADLAAALDKGKIDGYVLDEPIGRMTAQPYPDQRLSAMIELASYAFAFAKNSERSDLLRTQFDAFVKESRKNGVLQEVDDIWFGTDESRKTVSLDGLTGENGTVRLATSTDIGAPFVYFKEDGLVGYEIDLLARFCREYGYALEMTDYNFSAILAAVTSGKDDVACCTLAITEERKESVNFSVPTYEGGVVAVTKTASAENPSEDFAGQRLGLVVGTMFEGVAKEHYPEAELSLFNGNADLSEALDEGKLDAYMVDEPIGRLLVQSYSNQRISAVIEPASYAFAFAKDSERGNLFREQIDEFIEKSKRNGVLQELDDIWFGTDELRKTVDLNHFSGENGTLRLAVSVDVGEPFTYLKDGKTVGYEIDLLARFCHEYGYALETTNYNFSALLTAVTSEKDDIAACAIAITEDRQKIVDFSVPTYEGGVVVVTKSSPSFSAESFSGKKVGIFTGSVFDTMLFEQVPDARPEYINTYSDLAAALAAGKIDAYIADEPVTRLMRNQYPDQEAVFRLEDTSYAFMFPKGDEKHQKLCREFNEFLAQCWADGTIEEIDSVWFGNDKARQDVDISDLTAENGVLEMAVASDVGAPFTYLWDGHMIGYDVDVAARFCRAYGYGLHITDYNFAGVLGALSAGKADMAACSIAITPERQESALMSDPDYIGGIVIVTRVGTAETEQTSFWGSLQDSFERTFLRENRWKLFVSGIGVTFLITLISMILGSLGGFAMYRILRRGNKVFNGIWSVFAGVMGRMPMVVILMILYYIVFGRSDLSSVWVSVIGFTVLFICTVAELLKMGAGAVDKGQAEAALALGYSERQTYFRIIFPQSVEHFLPAYKNEVVTLVKATAVVGYIAVQDLTKISDLIRARTYEAFFPLIATAIIYLLLTLALTWLIRRIHIMTDPRRRDKKKILWGIETEEWQDATL